MNSFTASAIGAVFLAAALTTLTTLLWPGNPIALMIAATIAIFLNGWLAARLVQGGAKSSQQPATSTEEAKPKQKRTEAATRATPCTRRQRQRRSNTAR